MTMATTITYRNYTHRYLDEQTATAIAADVTTKPKSDFRNVTSELRDEIEPSMGNAGGASLTKAGADSKFAGGGDMGPSEF